MGKFYFGYANFKELGGQIEHKKAEDVKEKVKLFSLDGRSRNSFSPVSLRY